MNLNFFKQIGVPLFDVALEMAKRVKDRSLDLTKIEVVTLYIKTIDAIRQVYLSTTLLVFGVILLANIVNICQITIILYSPWETSQRILAAIGLSFLSFSIPLFFLLRSFSQKKWMAAFKGNEVLTFALGEERLHSKETLS